MENFTAYNPKFIQDKPLTPITIAALFIIVIFLSAGVSWLIYNSDRWLPSSHSQATPSPDTTYENPFATEALTVNPFSQDSLKNEDMINPFITSAKESTNPFAAFETQPNSINQVITDDYQNPFSL